MDRGLYVHKNTFLEYREPQDQQRPLSRSQSDSDISGLSSSRTSGSESEFSSGIVEGSQPRDDTATRPGASDARTALSLEEELQKVIASNLLPGPRLDHLREELHTVPKDPETGCFTSLGSVEHPDACSACHFWFRGLCKKGIGCDYCHFSHPGQKAKHLRLSKRTRMQRKQEAVEQAQGAGSHPSSGSATRPANQPAASGAPAEQAEARLKAATKQPQKISL